MSDEPQTPDQLVVAISVDAQTGEIGIHPPGPMDPRFLLGVLDMAKVEVQRAYLARVELEKAKKAQPSALAIDPPQIVTAHTQMPRKLR